MRQRNKTREKEREGKKKTPSSFIHCVALPEEEQGASKCRNLIYGTTRRHSNSMRLKDMHLAPFLFSAPLYWYPPLKETSVCSAALAWLKSPLKWVTHPDALWSTDTHILFISASPHQILSPHQMLSPHQILSPHQMLSPHQVPSQTQRPTVTFAVTRYSQRAGTSLATGRAVYVTPDWLVLGKRSAYSYCHWAVMDEVAGVGHRPRSQDRRLFTAPWLPSR